MADQGLLHLFDDAPAAATARPHAPASDEAVTLALAYEQAVLDCLETFKNRNNLRAQAEACVRFDGAMAAFMALPRTAYQRGNRVLNRRGKVTGMEWRLIRERMVTLLVMGR